MAARLRSSATTFASAKAALRPLAGGLAREFGPQKLHVGHVIVDGMIEGDQLLSRFPAAKERAGADGMLQPDAIADVYWVPPRATAQRVDLRARSSALQRGLLTSGFPTGR